MIPISNRKRAFRWVDKPMEVTRDPFMLGLQGEMGPRSGAEKGFECDRAGTVVRLKRKDRNPSRKVVNYVSKLAD
jgi:hypothetical protein